MDGSAVLALRPDRKFSTDESQTLLHAREAKPGALRCGFWIKPRTEISDSELNVFRAPQQFHFEAPYPTVLAGITECLL